MLGGCATQYVASAKPFSKAVTPICISKQDQMTEGTAQQIEADNLALQQITKRRVPCAQPKS
jgi:hypothetical protein